MAYSHKLNPVGGYMPSDDEVTAAYEYHGFLKTDGKWYIVYYAVSGNNTSVRYAEGLSGYAAAWTNRAGQSYQTYDKMKLIV